MATPTEVYRKTRNGHIQYRFAWPAWCWLYDYAVQLEEQLRAMTADRDRLEGELAAVGDALEGESDTVDGYDGDGIEHSRPASRPERIVNIKLERDALRGWNRKLRQDLEKVDNELLAEIAAKERLEAELEEWRNGYFLRRYCAERDEARQVAAGLLRLARAQDYRLSALENKLTNFNLSAPLAAEGRIVAALAALPPGVRRLLQE